MAQFTSYNAVLPWTGAIKQAVLQRQMPPWSADPAHSLKFRNDPRLSDADIATIRAWVDAGAPRGEGTVALDRLADANDWHGPGGRKPDLVISMNKDVNVPATGDLPYVRYLVQLPLMEDKWIAASEARPGNASVVHHMAITEVAMPEGVPNGDIHGLEEFYRKLNMSIPVRPVVGPHGSDVIDMVSIYTPGTTLEEYADDSAKLLKGGKNRYVDFNIHYSGHGFPATDRSQVAFWFRGTPPRHQIYRVAMSGGTILANGKELLTDTSGEKAEGTAVAIPPIPPGDASYELTAITAFPQPVTIFQLHPHAHLRAWDFRYVIVYPDGKEQTLLSVPSYDFHWQMAYELATPLKVPAGSKLLVTAHYDNSVNNRSNPSPDQKVFFRAQNTSTDEMFSPFAQYSVDSENPANPSESASKDSGAPLVETVGCLVSWRSGWLLTNAVAPVPTVGEASSSAEVSKAPQADLGNEQLLLRGVAPFQPAKHSGAKVIVKGLKTGRGDQLNVTSLLEVSGACP